MTREPCFKRVTSKKAELIMVLEAMLTGWQPRENVQCCLENFFLPADLNFREKFQTHVWRI